LKSECGEICGEKEKKANKAFYLLTIWRWAQSLPILSQHPTLLTGKFTGYFNKSNALVKQNHQLIPGKATLPYILVDCGTGKNSEFT